MSVQTLVINITSKTNWTAFFGCQRSKEKALSVRNPDVKMLRV
jgi:hypothetical protein